MTDGRTGMNNVMSNNAKNDTASGSVIINQVLKSV